MQQKIIFTLITLLTFTFSIQQTQAQCSGHKSTSYQTTNHHHKNQNIIDIAIENDQFATLVKAVSAAELVEAIKTSESITLLAPTNSAFGKIDSKTLNSLLDPVNKNILQAILTYHVIPGKFDAAALINAIKLNGGQTSIKTLSGETLIASINNDILVLKDNRGNISAVTQADIPASNGIIHVIDNVVLP